MSILDIDTATEKICPKDNGTKSKPITSYPSLIIRLAVSGSVSKLQPSEIMHALELTSQGRSRSKLIVGLPNERA